ncbi:MAG TPA: hypothetical protein VE781_13045, partial [Kineosporiaceae bacterium]|nr:hypothetical protein [Kineosporiaceae bacterium]
MSKPLQALDAALEELLTVRFAPLSPQVVLAAAEAWERVAARVCAGRLVMLAALGERDDVIPKARAGQGAVTFAQHVAGQSRAQARRAAQTASLLSARGGDLPRTGTALAAGDISSEHAQVAVRAHQELGAAARDLLVPCELAA